MDKRSSIICFLYKWKKSILLLVSVIPVLCTTVSGTMAYLMDASEPVTNTLKPAIVRNQVEEYVNGNTKTNVHIWNTGDTVSYIRAAIVVTWKNDNGDIYSTKPVENTDYEIVMGSSSKWKQASDRLYYYTDPVEANGRTDILFQEIKLKPECTAPADFYLDVEILSSGIQALPHDAVREAWKSGVSGFVMEDGKETDILTIMGAQ